MFTFGDNWFYKPNEIDIQTAILLWAISIAHVYIFFIQNDRVWLALYFQIWMTSAVSQSISITLKPQVGGK